MKPVDFKKAVKDNRSLDSAEVAALDLDAFITGSKPALLYAIDHSAVNVVKSLLTHAKNLNLNAQTANGDTGLHLAVYEDAEMVQLLLKNGANPHIHNNYNQTALQLAFRFGSPNVIDALEDPYINKPIPLAEGYARLAAALDNPTLSSEWIIQHIIDKIEPFLDNMMLGEKNIEIRHRILGKAMAKGQEAIVEKLKSHQIPFDNETKCEYCIECEKRKEMDKAIVQLESLDHKHINFDTRVLLKRFLDELNPKITSHEQFKKIISKCCEYGVDIKDESLIETLVSVTDISKLQILLAHGANINVKNKAGKTQLHNAVMENDNERLELLLNLGADINARDFDGHTPLMSAMLQVDVAMMALLLSKGADIDIPDKKGNFLIDVARSFRSQDILNLILSHTHPHRIKTIVEDIKNFFHRLGLSVDRNEEIQIPLGNNNNISIRTEGNADSVSARANAEDMENYLEKGFNSYESTTQPIDSNENTTKSNDSNENTTKSNDSNENTTKSYFAKIHKSFSMNSKIRNLDSDAPSSDELIARIKSGQMTQLTSGWVEHSIGVAFYKGKMIISNRGEGMEAGMGVAIYDIVLDKVDKTFIEAIYLNPSLCSHQKMQTTKEVLKGIIKPNTNPVCVFEAKAQKRGSCSYVNPKSSTIGLLYLLKEEELHNANNALPQGKQLSQEEISRISKGFALQEYKKYTTFMRDTAMDDLIAKIQDTNNPFREVYINIGLKMLKNTSPDLVRNESNARTKIPRMYQLVQALEQIPPKMIKNIIENDPYLQDKSLNRYDYDYNAQNYNAVYLCPAYAYAAYMGDSQIMQSIERRYISTYNSPFNPDLYEFAGKNHVIQNISSQLLSYITSASSQYQEKNTNENRENQSVGNRENQSDDNNRNKYSTSYLKKKPLDAVSDNLSALLSAANTIDPRNQDEVVKLAQLLSDTGKNNKDPKLQALCAEGLHSLNRVYSTNDKIAQLNSTIEVSPESDRKRFKSTH